MKKLKALFSSSWIKKDSERFKGGKPPKKPWDIWELFLNIKSFIKIFWVNLTIKNIKKNLFSKRTVIIIILYPLIFFFYRPFFHYIFEQIQIEDVALYVGFFSGLFTLITRVNIIDLLDQVNSDFKNRNPNVKVNVEISKVVSSLIPENLKQLIIYTISELISNNLSLMKLTEGEEWDYELKDQVDDLIKKSFILTMDLKDILNPGSSPEPGSKPSAPSPGSGGGSKPSALSNNSVPKSPSQSTAISRPQLQPRKYQFILPKPGHMANQPSFGIAGPSTLPQPNRPFPLAGPSAPLPGPSVSTPIPTPGKLWQGVRIHEDFRLRYYKPGFAFGMQLFSLDGKEWQDYLCVHISNPNEIKKFSIHNFDPIHKKYIQDIYEGLVYVADHSNKPRTRLFLDETSWNYLDDFCKHHNIPLSRYNSKILRDALLVHIKSWS